MPVREGAVKSAHAVRGAAALLEHGAEVLDATHEGTVVAKRDGVPALQAPERGEDAQSLVGGG